MNKLWRNNLIGLTCVAGLGMGGAAGAATFDVGNGDIGFKAGNWDISLAGEVNGFYTYSNCDSPTPTVAGSLTCTGGNTSDVRNGLLPAALIISAATTQNGLDIGFDFGLFPGINNRFDDGVNAGIGGNVALASGPVDVRIASLHFGTDTLGTVTIGRNIDIFGRDAILSDMTIAGVGGNLVAGTPPNTSVGRIGVGYIFTDFQPQISYSSPTVGGLNFKVGVFQPLNSFNFAGIRSFGNPNDPTDDIPFSGTTTEHPEPQFQANINYANSEFLGGLADTKLWAGAVYQKLGANRSDNVSHGTTAKGYEFGGRFGVGNAEVVGYYYTGEALGISGYFFDAVTPTGEARDSDGWYAQGTYQILGRTKLGFSYGQSTLDAETDVGSNSSLIDKQSSYIYGIYHHLTQSLQLVAEYTDQETEAHNGNNDDEHTISVGAILFF